MSVAEAARLLDLELLSWFALLGGPGGQPASGADEGEVGRLIEAARGGDRAAGNELYRLHVRHVFRAVRSLVRDEAEAEEVVQEAFVRALTGLDRYRPREGARFASWLAAIALNVARRRARWWRRAVGEDEAPKEAAAGTQPDAGEELDLARRKAALLQALGELEPREREIVSLRYGAELTAAEVGEALGLGEANVRKICERQRKRLLERLRETLGEPGPGTDGEDGEGAEARR